MDLKCVHKFLIFAPYLLKLLSHAGRVAGLACYFEKYCYMIMQQHLAIYLGSGSKRCLQKIKTHRLLMLKNMYALYTRLQGTLYAGLRNSHRLDMVVLVVVAKNNLACQFHQTTPPFSRHHSNGLEPLLRQIYAQPAAFLASSNWANNIMLYSWISPNHDRAHWLSSFVPIDPCIPGHGLDARLPKAKLPASFA